MGLWVLLWSLVLDRALEMLLCSVVCDRGLGYYCGAGFYMVCVIHIHTFKTLKHPEIMSKDLSYKLLTEIWQLEQDIMHNIRIH